MDDTFREQTIKGLRFICTCEACPEQYEVFDGDKQVGYVKLRWGQLRVDYPDVRMETIYDYDFETEFKGYFDNQDEREHYLNIIADKINQHHKKVDKR